MAHEETIWGIILRLVIFDRHTIGDIMAYWGIWSKGPSRLTNTDKILKGFVGYGKLIREDGYFRLPTCSSRYMPHAQLLTKCLAEIIKVNPDCKIFRERTIAEKGLRPDAIILLTKDNLAACLILEAMDTETESYFEMKKNTWEAWDGATANLSDLFGETIPYISIIRSDTLKAYLEGL